MADTPKRRGRRHCTDEFKPAPCASCLTTASKTVSAAGRDLDLTETVLRELVKRASADRTHGRTGLTTAGREELVRLRRALWIEEEERDIPKKATAFFAKQSR